MTQPTTDGLPSFIDRRWVADALVPASVASGATLLEIGFAGWIGTGQMARSARITLRWDGPSDLPASVVVKVPSADPETAAFAFAQGGYLTELRFYRDIAPTVGCRVPGCHRTEYRPDDLEFALVMEDIAGAEQGDQFAGLRPEQLDLAIEQAVRLHAPRYGDPTLGRAFAGPDGRASATADLADFAQLAYAASVEVMLDRLGDGLDDEVIEAFRTATPHIARWAHSRPTAETVVHGDLRGDNLLFGDGTSAPEVVVVDWQTVRPGPAAVDLAYLIAGSVPEPSDRADLEPDLVVGYVDRMAAAGVTLDRDTFWTEYRLGSIWGLLITAVATMQAARNDRGDALFTLMAQRHGWQAVHLEPLALLT
jgi:hypothetical protein